MDTFPSAAPVFSILLATLNRPEEVKGCLGSFLGQSFGDFEVIIADQSRDRATENVIRDLGDERFKYMSLGRRGLSYARNEALGIARGSYIVLADDDAFYEADYLENANRLLQDMPDKNRILSGYIWDTQEKRGFSPYQDKYEGKALPLKLIMTTCPSAGLILPSGLFGEIGDGGFDETFGVGAAFGACEETDLLLSALKWGYEVIYCPGLRLRHPWPTAEKRTEREAALGKLESYSAGLGALYGKHLFGRGEIELLPLFMDKLLKLILKRLLIFKFDPEESAHLLRGFIRGLRHEDISGNTGI